MNEQQARQELTDIFFAEAGDMLATASSALLDAEAKGNPNEAVNPVFRAVHSIKGGAQSLELGRLAEVAHRLEDLLDPIRQGLCSADSSMVSLMLEAIDLMDNMLTAYRGGEQPDFLASRQEALLSSVAGFEKKICSVARKVPPTGVKSPRSKQPAGAGGKRLLYLHYVIDPFAPMPQARRFILLNKLDQSGAVLYTRPVRETIELTFQEDDIFDLSVVLQTDLSDNDIKKMTDVGDIKEFRLAEMGTGVFCGGNRPTIEQIKQFNYSVARLAGKLEAKDGFGKELRLMALEIASWGERCPEGLEWLPGGRRAWRRQAVLLIRAVSLLAASFEKGIRRGVSEEMLLASGALQSLWEWVYEGLCNRSYFYSPGILYGNRVDYLVEQAGKIIHGTDAQVVVLDLSGVLVLEPSDLHMLAEFANSMVQQGISLLLVMEKDYSRRHLNVLEATGRITGLKCHLSPYQGCLTLYGNTAGGRDKDVP